MIQIYSLIEENVGASRSRGISKVPCNVILFDEPNIGIVKDHPTTSDFDNGDVMAMMVSHSNVNHDTKEFVESIWILGVIRSVEKTQFERKDYSIGELDELCSSKV